MIGKIYKIIHTQSDIVYVGSTFNTLRNRWASHKAPKYTKCAIHPYIKQYGQEQFKIILIKEYEVVDRTHLEAYEQLWINKLKCINISNTIKIQKHYSKNYYEKNKVLISEKCKTYRNTNPEIIKERKRLYRESNKEQISEKAKQKIICEVCNSSFRKGGINRHEKTKKHLDAMNS